MSREFVKISLAVVIVCLLTAKTTLGVLTLSVADVNVELKQSSAWTVWRLTKANSPVINYWRLSIAQGVVLLINGQWTGSSHGNEQVLSASVFVDGVERPVADGLSYSGEVIKFVRNTTLGQAYRLTSIMTIKQEYTNEYIVMQGLDANKTCTRFYGYLGARDYPLSHYAAYDNNGVILYSGVCNYGEPEVYRMLGSCPAVAQYDPDHCYGVCSITNIGTEYDLSSFVWDRITDNKLYQRFTSLEGTCDPNKYFSLNQKLVFFEAPTDTWMTVAGEIAVANMACPAGDMGSKFGSVKDCRVDMLDIATVGLGWNQAQPGDMDDNGFVDYLDLGEIVSFWLDFGIDQYETQIE